MNKYIKLLLACALFILSIYYMLNRMVGLGVLIMILSSLPVILFFFNEYILLSFLRLRKQDMEGASKWLKKITNPEKQLYKKQYGYFNYLKGITIAQSNPAKSEDFMRKALSYGLRFRHDRALATLNIAATSLMKGRKKEAERLLSEAKKLDKSNILDEQIKMLREQIKRTNLSQRNMINPNIRNKSKIIR